MAGQNKWMPAEPTPPKEPAPPANPVKQVKLNLKKILIFFFHGTFNKTVTVKNILSIVLKTVIELTCFDDAPIFSICSCKGGALRIILSQTCQKIDRNNISLEITLKTNHLELWYKHSLIKISV